jgi:hypothetical protein
MTIQEINYALADIKETLAIYANQPMTAYTQKLWNEVDNLIDLKIKLERAA